MKLIHREGLRRWNNYQTFECQREKFKGKSLISKVKTTKARELDQEEIENYCKRN